MKIEFSGQIFGKKKARISNLIEISPVGAELCHTGGRTDSHDEANSRFLQFCKCAYQATKIPELNGTQTRDPSNGATADLRLRPHRHR